MDSLFWGISPSFSLLVCILLWPLSVCFSCNLILLLTFFLLPIFLYLSFWYWEFLSMFSGSHTFAPFGSPVTGWISSPKFSYLHMDEVYVSQIAASSSQNSCSLISTTSLEVLRYINKINTRRLWSLLFLVLCFDCWIWFWSPLPRSTLKVIPGSLCLISSQWRTMWIGLWHHRCLYKSLFCSRTCLENTRGTTTIRLNWLIHSEYPRAVYSIHVL